MRLWIRRYWVVPFGVLALVNFVARQPRRLTRAEVAVLGVWDITSPLPGSAPVMQQVLLDPTRRYCLEGATVRAGFLTVCDTGSWDFAEGHLRLYSDNAPLNRFRGFQELHWSLLAERIRRLRHGPRASHDVPLTIQSENQAVSDGLVWTRVHPLPALSDAPPVDPAAPQAPLD